MEVHRGTKIHDSKKGRKETKRRSQWRRPIHAVPIGTNVYTKVVHVTSLAECLRRYRANKKTRIIVDTVLEVGIGPKATAFGRRRTFVVVRFYLGGGAMKVATINIQSVKLNNP